MPDEIDLSPEDEKALDAARRKSPAKTARRPQRSSRRLSKKTRPRRPLQVRGAAPVRPRLLPLGEPVDEEV